MPSGPYIVLPIFGPSNLRDTAGRFISASTDPVNIYGKTKLDGDNPFAKQILMAYNSDLGLESIQSISHLKYKLMEEGKSNVLGTYGATAPFIGLLGTVFGIIVAFGELSSGKVDSNSIMYALAEALILTAVGLIVAIPSVMCFNHFSKQLKTERERVHILQTLIKKEHS